MPRRNRGNEGGGRPLPGGLGDVRTESGADGDWHVRPVPAARADKAYRCPGCAQQVPPGVAHVVAWPAEVGGAEVRRHWHTACWTARHRRRPA